MSILVIVLSTFISEDLTCITVGLLIHTGHLDPVTGLLGCFLGIFAGDLGLWLTGRLLGLGLLQRSWLRHRLPAQRLEDLGAWFDRHGWAAVVAARFLPGTRLPLYLAAGALGRKAGRFILWAALAGLVWTPLLVMTTAFLGDAVVGPFATLLGGGWLALLLGTITLWLVVRMAIRVSSPVGRARLIARISRLWRWEFWPSWLFYLPLLPWLAYLSLRYRGVLTWTAANPGIPQGGVVGESKQAILQHLPAEWVVPSILVPPGDHRQRITALRQQTDERGWAFPWILKPDAGQRGAGVKQARDWGEVEEYLQAMPAAVMVQPYHPGPFEAGIFYYRLPGEPVGHLFSITDKVFPLLRGDGSSTLEELIWRHPRYRMQAHTFLARHAADRHRVLAEGKPFLLALAGNHCQGTTFHDGSHLRTPELAKTIDAIAQRFPGFFIGRFDVRYTDVAAFKAGRDLAIVELNGVTSESTNIYDPSWSLLRAYRILFRQWSLLYRIGAANRQRGYSPTGIRELVRLIRSFYAGARADRLSD